MAGRRKHTHTHLAHTHTHTHTHTQSARARKSRRRTVSSKETLSSVHFPVSVLTRIAKVSAAAAISVRLSVGMATTPAPGGPPTVP